MSMYTKDQNQPQWDVLKSYMFKELGKEGEQ